VILYITVYYAQLINFTVIELNWINTELTLAE